MKIKRGLELVSSLFGLQNMFGKIYFSVIYHLANINDLTRSGFWVTPKITFANYTSQLTMS